MAQAEQVPPYPPEPAAAQQRAGGPPERSVLGKEAGPDPAGTSGDPRV